MRIKYIQFDNWPIDGHSYDWLNEEQFKKDKFEYERWQYETLYELIPNQSELARRLKISQTAMHYRLKRYGVIK